MLTHETPLSFGRSHRLFGLLTEPAGAAAAPVVILLNAGLIHHVGPRRIHVRLARRLAGRGLRVLRIDLSGIGDSESRRDGLSAVEGVVSDVREAMDALAQRLHAREFVLFGICSGAKIAFQVARRDPRVVGTVLIDPGDFGRQAQASPASGDSAFVQHYVRHYWRSVFSKGLSLKRVVGWFTGKANYAYARKVLSTQLRGLFGSRREARETREALSAELEALAARGARSLLLYGEQGASRVFFEMMLQESLARRAADGRIAVRILPETDHNFVTLASQAQLLRAVESWVEPWSAATAAPEAKPAPAVRAAVAAGDFGGTG
jgi:pimeloyl-ACP methyl ester carboxylesterase